MLKAGRTAEDLLNNQTIRRSTAKLKQVPEAPRYILVLSRYILVLSRYILVLPRYILVLPRYKLVLSWYILVLPRYILVPRTRWGLVNKVLYHG